LITEFIVGGFDDGPALFRVDLFGSITSEKYISSGSGSPIALGVLESEYSDDLDLDSAVRLAVKSLMASLSRDAATGNWIDLVAISERGVVEYSDEEKQKLIDGVWNARGR
jgi:proteasome beta subunit